MPADVHAGLLAAVARNPQVTVKIDLPSQTLMVPGGRRVEFPVDAFAKHCLLEGVDEIGYTLQREWGFRRS